MTSSSVDAIFTTDINIIREGENLIILGAKIHIDDLWKDQVYYHGNYSNYMIVEFNKKNKSVEITRSSGGMGGNGTYNYKGTKK